MAVEVPLRGKYRAVGGKKQTSRSNVGGSDKKRTKAKGEVLKLAQQQTREHQRVLLLEGGTHRRWIREG
jgi:hypothetical protein